MIVKSLMDVQFSFLDLETTGLYNDLGDRVCEIAILTTRGTEVVDYIDTLLHPQRRIPPLVQSVHGITDEMVRDAPYFVEIAEIVAQSLCGSVIVAHNAPFDIGFLNSEFERVNVAFPVGKVADTLRIARNHFDFPSYRLGDIAREIDLFVGSNHRAMVDARLTKAVFEYLIGDLEKRGFAFSGVEDVIGLENYASVNHSARINSYAVHSSLFQSAIREKVKLEIIYYSPQKQKTTTRVIEPLEIQAQGRREYVVAYCHMRKDRRQFRLDRIISARRAES